MKYLCLLFLVVFACLPAAAQEYKGLFLPAPLAETWYLAPSEMLLLPPGLVKHPFEAKEGMKSWAVILKSPEKSLAEPILSISRAGGGIPQACLDSDGDKEMKKEECQEMKPLAEAPARFEAAFMLPYKAGPLNGYPLIVRIGGDIKQKPFDPASLMAEFSVFHSALGKAEIDGKSLLFSLELKVFSRAVDPFRGYSGMDTNGDGKIYVGNYSAESAYNEAPREEVFRAGDSYYSISSASLEKNEAIIRKREKKDYLFIEPELGKEIPDFSFSGFSAGNPAFKKRKLSDFRGKYLLLDFWGFWCPDCVEQIPFQREAYRKFKARGFEILGMNTDRDTKTPLGTLLRRAAITWPQSAAISSKPIANNLFRITEYPAAMLLGPDGKVLVIDKKKLEGPELAKTLDAALPK